jgi:hypothetical protein
MEELNRKLAAAVKSGARPKWIALARAVGRRVKGLKATPDGRPLMVQIAYSNMTMGHWMFSQLAGDASDAAVQDLVEGLLADLDGYLALLAGVEAGESRARAEGADVKAAAEAAFRAWAEARAAAAA